MSKERIITMSETELTRLEAMQFLKEKKRTQKEIAKELGLSRRQTKRLWREYKLHGANGLISKRRGKPSSNKFSEKFKDKVVKLIKEKYTDFGPTFLHEKLLENHNICVSKETLRQWMIADHLWRGKHRKDIKVHQLRDRRECFGELVQIDGSFHDWFEGRREKCCLLVFIDDATSKILQLRFEEGETTAGYFKAVRSYICQYGLPLAFYSDRDSIFRNNMPETSHEGLTQFGRAMQSLNIEIICANSAPAKGRVERANKVLQDRLIKEMRIRGISDIKTANAYLLEFADAYNKRFEKEPKNKIDMHRKLTKSEEELNLIFSFQQERKLSKNLELSFENIVYQIQTQGQGYGLRHAKVMVCKDLKGNVTLLYKGRTLNYRCYKKQKLATEIVGKKMLHQKLNRIVKKIYKPKSNHPWRQWQESTKQTA
jgi:hypothetical protein